MKFYWALLLAVMDIASFLSAVYFYWQGDFGKATFWLAMSISLELSTVRAFRRAAGKSFF